MSSRRVLDGEGRYLGYIGMGGFPAHAVILM